MHNSTPGSATAFEIEGIYLEGSGSARHSCRQYRVFDVHHLTVISHFIRTLSCSLLLVHVSGSVSNYLTHAYPRTRTVHDDAAAASV